MKFVKSQIKIALVGCGYRGINIANLFQKHPQCEISALMDIYELPMQSAKETLNIDVPTYTSFEALLKDKNCDALFIASDPLIQVDQACQAMEAGFDVCTEVPAAFSIDECWKLVKTVQKTGQKYQLMEQLRYSEFIEQWTFLNQNGEFGHISFAQGEYIHDLADWGIYTDTKTGRLLDSNHNIYRDRNYENFDTSKIRVEEGKEIASRSKPNWRYELFKNPINYLPHTLSPTLKVLNDRVQTVSCIGNQLKSYAYDLPWSDLQYASMKTEKDTMLFAGAGFSFPHIDRGPLGCHWYDFRGTEGCAESPRSKGDHFRVWKRGEEHFVNQDYAVTPKKATKEEADTGHGGLDYKPVSLFIECLLNDQQPDMDVYKAVETAAPAILASESYQKNGKTFEVPNFRN